MCDDVIGEGSILGVIYHINFERSSRVFSAIVVTQVRRRKDVLSKVAHKRGRIDIGYEMDDFKHQKENHIVKFVLVGKDN